jgi:hypothetical protein
MIYKGGQAWLRLYECGLPDVATIMTIEGGTIEFELHYVEFGLRSTIRWSELSFKEEFKILASPLILELL